MNIARKIKYKQNLAEIGKKENNVGAYIALENYLEALADVWKMINETGGVGCDCVSRRELLAKLAEVKK